MTRPQVTFNGNGEVVLSTEINGLIVSMRMAPNVADELASAIGAMAEHARKFERKSARLHELFNGKPIDFDAQQVREEI